MQCELFTIWICYYVHGHNHDNDYTKVYTFTNNIYPLSLEFVIPFVLDCSAPYWPAGATLCFFCIIDLVCIDRKTVPPLADRGYCIQITK